METAINTAQMRAIYGMAKKASIGDDELHDMVRSIARKDSLKELTGYQAGRVIERLKAELGQPVDTGTGRSTRNQRGKIMALARELGWIAESGEVDRKRLDGFLHARWGVARLEWVPYDRVGGVIEAMKAMADGDRGERRRKEG